MASQPLPAAWAAYEVAERDQDGNPPLMSDDDEQLLQQYHDVLLTLGSDLEQGVGKLFITSRRVIWLSEEDQQRGIAIPFSDIAMHAMCSDTSSFPRPCVYAQLQSDFAEEGSDDEAGADDATELRFSPQDAGAVLEPMFKAFCEGAAMNPDEDLQEEGGAPLFFNSEEVMAGADPAAREAMLARLDGMLDEGEYEDEVDEEEDALYEDADEDGPPAVNGR